MLGWIGGKEALLDSKQLFVDLDVRKGDLCIIYNREANNC